MKKPQNRKERIELLIQKLGIDFVTGMYAFTDKEVKQLFEVYWKRGLKDRQDYKDDVSAVECIRCGQDVMTETYCGCGMNRAVYDIDSWIRDLEDNPDGDDELTQLAKTENKEFRKKYNL